MKEIEEVSMFEENIALKKTVFTLLHAFPIDPKACNCWAKTILKSKVQTLTLFLRIYLSVRPPMNYEHLDKNGCYNVASCTMVDVTRMSQWSDLSRHWIISY